MGPQFWNSISENTYESKKYSFIITKFAKRIKHDLMLAYIRIEFCITVFRYDLDNWHKGRDSVAEGTRLQYIF